MKRIFLWISNILLAAFMLSSCGGADKHTQAEPEYVFTYAENQAEDYPTTRGALKFAELVKERTGGRIIINVEWGGSLGDEKTVIAQLQMGGVDFMRASISPLASYVRKLDVLQLPYLYRDSEHMWRVLNGDIGREFMSGLEGSGLVALSWYDAGARSFYNSVKPIERLEDLKGLRIRVQESDLMLEMVRLLGAEGIAMPYGDVYSALETGTIDGAENNLPSYESANHYKVAGYFTVDEHARVPELQLISAVTWNKLSDEYKEIIMECAAESSECERELWVEREKTSLEMVMEQGCRIVRIDKEERARFKAAVEGLYEKYYSDYIDIVKRIENE